MSVSPSRISGSGWESLPDDRKWLGFPYKCLGVDGRPSWMSGSGWEALLEVWK